MEMKIGLAVFAALLLLDICAGEFRKPRALSMNELGVNLLSMLIAFSIRALPLAVVSWLLVRFWPTGRDLFAGVNLWLMFIVVLLIDDYLNYWLHRMAHKVPVLWRLHKPHHIPTRMNVLMGGRENAFYYLLLPVNVMAPLLVFTGAATAGAMVFGLKIVVAYLQHTGFRWDLWLRRSRLAGGVLGVFEKVFSLQDFHHVHHGIGRYGNASSNYGNILSFWDALHGSSSGHPRRRQDAYGLPVGVAVESWAEQLFWPLVRLQPKLQPASAKPVQSSAEELAAAPAVIYTADGTAIAVSL